MEAHEPATMRWMTGDRSQTKDCDRHEQLVATSSNREQVAM